MTLDQLIMLQAIAELSSVKAASEALHKTQPAISQGLKQLEQQLGVQIVDRSRYRLSLTEDGKRIYQQARRILNEADELKTLSQHLAAGNEASLTLAVEGTFDIPAILPALEDVQLQFPETEIHLQQEFLSGALQAVTTGQADIAISPMTPEMIESSSIDAVRLSQFNLISVATEKFLAKHPDISESLQLKDAYQIVVRDSGQLTGQTEYGVQGGQRKWYVNDFHTKKMLIMSGMGWGRVPENRINSELQSGALKILQLRDNPGMITIQHYLLRPLKRTYGPVARYIWEQFTQVLSNKNPTDPVQ